MKRSSRHIGDRPDPLTVTVVGVVAALSLTIAAQVRAAVPLDRTSVVHPHTCTQLMHVTDTRIDGRTARRLRAGQPCLSRAQALQAMLSIWAVAGR